MYRTAVVATTATRMISSLPQIRIGLMVGIGAGIPRPSEDIDIRLGDVVVSQPSRQHGRVAQYDLGKAKTGNDYERKGFLNSPPPALLKAVAQLQAEYEESKSSISGIAAAMLQKHPQ
ncbi:hypothetical protein DL767_009234 [Monosporascus sp. MG133]|nr:hypothetical protein DL767_009234 [Monosporascus sp. MG133]